MHSIDIIDHRLNSCFWVFIFRKYHIPAWSIKYFLQIIRQSIQFHTQNLFRSIENTSNLFYSSPIYHLSIGRKPLSKNEYMDDISYTHGAIKYISRKKYCHIPLPSVDCLRKFWLTFYSVDRQIANKYPRSVENLVWKFRFKHFYSSDYKAWWCQCWKFHCNQ